MRYTEITKEAFDAIVTDEQQAFDYNDKQELAEKTYFKAKGMNLLTVYNFISNVKQYFLLDINF